MFVVWTTTQHGTTPLSFDNLTDATDMFNIAKRSNHDALTVWLVDSRGDRVVVRYERNGTVMRQAGVTPRT